MMISAHGESPLQGSILPNYNIFSPSSSSIIYIGLMTWDGVPKCWKDYARTESSQRHNTKHIGGVDVVSIKVIMMIVIASIYESLQSWLQPSFNERRRSVREVCGRSGTLIQILFSCLFVFKGWDWFTTQQLRSRPEI